MQHVLQTALSVGLSATEGIHSSKPNPVPPTHDGRKYLQPSSFVPQATDRMTLRGKYENVSVSYLAIGAWSWGDKATWHWSPSELPHVKEAWQYLLENGINYIDTAQAYGSGESERICGSLVAGLPRSSFAIQTKYYVVPRPENLLHQAKSVVKDLEDSLARLKLQELDVYVVHGPIHPGSVKTVAKGLNECVERRLTKTVAVANYSAEDMEEMCDALAEYGIPLALNQCEYSVLRRLPETSGLLEACNRRGVIFQSYSSLAQGRLTGKYNQAHPPPKTYRFSSYPMEDLEPTLRVLGGIAEKRGVAMAAVALNYNMCRGVMPVVGVRNLDHAKGNLQAFGWRLSDEEVAEIDKVSIEGKSTKLWQQG